MGIVHLNQRCIAPTMVLVAGSARLYRGGQLAGMMQRALVAGLAKMVCLMAVCAKKLSHGAIAHGMKADVTGVAFLVPHGMRVGQGAARVDLAALQSNERASHPGKRGGQGQYAESTLGSIHPRMGMDIPERDSLGAIFGRGSGLWSWIVHAGEDFYQYFMAAKACITMRTSKAADRGT